MKKLLSILLSFIIFSTFIFAVSYDDNEYQRKSRAYTELANRSYDEGDYDAAVEYAKLAEDYAQKSADFIQRMLARTEAEQDMNKARTRFTWAKQNKAETRFPEAYANAETALSAGSEAFDSENYDVAVVCANKVLEALSIVTGDETKPVDGTMLSDLPAEYKIRTWRGERDCLWNIAAQPAVYGNPFMWQKLYDANRDKMPDVANPNWVEPGIILKIPSLHGEKRTGMFDHSKIYKSLPKSKNK